MDCYLEAGRERDNSIFIFWLGPLKLGFQGKGKVRDHLLTDPIVLPPCKTHLSEESKV